MGKQSENISADEKVAKQAIAALALFGLTEALRDPPSQAIFNEAWRIIFTDSDELKKIATLLEEDVEILQKNTHAYLNKMGVCCEKKNYH